MPAMRIITTLVLCVHTGCQISWQTPGQPTHAIENVPSIDVELATPAELPVSPAPEIQPVAFIQTAQRPSVPEALTLPAPVKEPEWELTLDRLEQMALESNPAVARAAAQLEALRGKWVQVGLPPNPTIGYVSEEMGDEGTAGKQGGFVGQKFVTGGKLRLNRAVVSQEVAQAEQNLAAQQQRVLTDVRLGYYNVLVSQRRLDLARELVGVSDRAVNASRELLKAQEIPRIGLLQTEVEAQNAQILLTQAQNGNVAAWRHLSSVVGQPDLPPRRLAGELGWTAQNLDWDEQLQRLFTASPEIANALSELEHARWSLNRAYAQVAPDVNVQAAVQHDNATDATVSGVQVGLPIPLWNKNQGGIRQARNRIIEAERNIQRVELDLRQRLAATFQEFADARFQVENFSREILPKARETFELVSEGYAKGEVGYLDMLIAQRTFFQTNLLYIEALHKLWRAYIRIDGLLLDGSLADTTVPAENG